MISENIAGSPLKKYNLGVLIAFNVVPIAIMVIGAIIVLAAVLSQVAQLSDNSTDEQIRDAFLDALPAGIVGIVFFGLGMVLAIGASIINYIVGYGMTKETQATSGDARDNARLYLWGIVAAVGASLLTMGVFVLIAFTAPALMTVSSIFTFPISIAASVIFFLIYYRNMKNLQAIRAARNLPARDQGMIAWILVLVGVFVGITAPIGQIMWVVEYNRTAAELVE